MPFRRWILVVEPDLNYRELIRAETTAARGDSVDIVCVSFASELVQAISHFGTLPELMIVEWFASGDQINTCMQGMRRRGMLERMPVVAISGESARRALCEAQALGMRRFICKFPDIVSFRKKIGEAIRDLVPADPQFC